MSRCSPVNTSLAQHTVSCTHSALREAQHTQCLPSPLLEFRRAPARDSSRPAGRLDRPRRQPNPSRVVRVRRPAAGRRLRPPVLTGGAERGGGGRGRAAGARPRAPPTKKRTARTAAQSTGYRGAARCEAISGAGWLFLAARAPVLAGRIQVSGWDRVRVNTCHREG